MPETGEALNRLAYALVRQLESPTRESWTQLDFLATRVALADSCETHKMSLTVWRAGGDVPLIPRPEANEACSELDRVATLGQRPRWRSLRLVMRRVDGRVSYKCHWSYDPSDGGAPERVG